MSVQVVESRCQEVAQRLTALGIPAPIEPWNSASSVDYDLATLNLVLVAVCHQTQRLAGEVNGVQRRGWDYLQVRFQDWARENAACVTAECLASFSADDLRHVLMSDEQLSTKDLANRAALIRDCGAVLNRMEVSSFTEVYEQCAHRIASTTPNLLTVLRNFSAFNDPVQKKSLFLLGLNSATCGWVYEDPESLDPPVDYHEVRGHLRLGTVRLANESLRQAVANSDPVNEADDVAIRTAVTDAIRRVSDLSGLSPMQLHYAFWNLFRAVCIRRQPLCRGKLQELVPKPYRHLVESDSCCFIDCCESAESLHAIDEHRFDTDWY